MRTLRIAQVAPLAESVPPAGYGGTERIVSYLTEELVEMGHRVTLFASGDSTTRAELISACPRALRKEWPRGGAMPYAILQLEQVFSRAAEFDIIHFHIDFLHLPLARRTPTPILTTMHGRLDFPDLVPFYDVYRDTPLISISDSQRAPQPRSTWAATVYHGLPPDLHRPGPGTGGYLAFVGRISPEKRPDLAIEIARRTEMELRIAAKVDAADADYFRAKIEPLLAKNPGVKFLGEVDEDAKSALLGDAAAMLFPIDWPEPFGIVQIESLACGTPVVAMRRGSVPEVLEHGVTGFIADDVDGAVAGVREVQSLDRARCRKEFERRFTSRRMAEDYVRVYHSLKRG